MPGPTSPRLRSRARTRVPEASPPCQNPCVWQAPASLGSLSGGAQPSSPTSETVLVLTPSAPPLLLHAPSGVASLASPALLCSLNALQGCAGIPVE